MTRWEYRLVEFAYVHGDVGAESELCRLGDEGWEAVGMDLRGPAEMPRAPLHDFRLVILMKRPARDH